MNDFSPVSHTRRHYLPNGLTVITHEDRSVPIVTCMIWYRVGSRMEAPGITGISHFLEHMMFKGTERFGKGVIDYITTRHGGANNAFTSNDYTAYYFSFASDRWEQALEVEADRMSNALFDSAEFELERQVVLEELKMELDNPWGALRQAVEIHSFEQHPYRFPVIGLHEDLRSLTVDRMRSYYHRFYVPANATLVLAGDFSTDAVLEQVERTFGPIAGPEAPAIELSPEPARNKEVKVVLERPTHIPRMLVSFPAPSVRQQDHYAMQILDKVLAEGKLSRLYQRMIEKERIASVVSTEFAETYDPYLLVVRMELYRGVEPGRAEAVLFEELNRLGREPISQSEFERAKNQCLMGFVSDFETTLDQAIQLGLLETIDRFEYWADYPDRIKQLEIDDLTRVAALYLAPERSTVGILTHGK